MSPRQITWRRLVPGVVGSSVILLGALAVLVFARVGSLRGDTYRLYVLADEARGVIKGTEIWLAGQKVGIVQGVAFRPVTADTTGRLAVELEVLRRYQNAIRRDSRVEFRAGGTPIGATIVAIDVGSPGSPLAREGDTLARAPQIDPDSIRSELSLAIQQLPGLLQDIQAMSAELHRNLVRGELATATGATGDHAPAMSILAKRTGRLAERMATGRGTIPLLIRDHELGEHARQAAARADSLLEIAGSGHGLLGRLRGDTALIAALTDVRNQITIVQREIDEERGTVGRLAHDSVLVHQLHELQANLTATIADAKRKPGRYITF
jgi:ABC-type transporter Mla subunit MlaD